MEPTLFEKIIETNIINFLIVLSTLVWIFKKAHLGSIIQKMADDIKTDVEESSQKASNALKEYKETRKATRGTEELQEKILKQAQTNAQLIKERIEEKAQIQKKDIKSNMKNAFEQIKEHYKNLTIDEIYSAGIELAKLEILKRLDKELHKKLINSSIDEIANIEGNLS